MEKLSLIVLLLLISNCHQLPTAQESDVTGTSDATSVATSVTVDASTAVHTSLELTTVDPRGIEMSCKCSENSAKTGMICRCLPTNFTLCYFLPPTTPFVSTTTTTQSSTTASVTTGSAAQESTAQESTTAKKARYRRQVEEEVAVADTNEVTTAAEPTTEAATEAAATTEAATEAAPTTEAATEAVVTTDKQSSVEASSGQSSSVGPTTVPTTTTTLPTTTTKLPPVCACECLLQSPLLHCNCTNQTDCADVFDCTLDQPVPPTPSPPSPQPVPTASTGPTLTDPPKVGVDKKNFSGPVTVVNRLLLLACPAAVMLLAQVFGPSSGGW